MTPVLAAHKHSLRLLKLNNESHVSVTTFMGGFSLLKIETMNTGLKAWIYFEKTMVHCDLVASAVT